MLAIPAPHVHPDYVGFGLHSIPDYVGFDLNSILDYKGFAYIVF